MSVPQPHWDKDGVPRCQNTCSWKRGKGKCGVPGEVMYWVLEDERCPRFDSRDIAKYNYERGLKDGKLEI